MKVYFRVYIWKVFGIVAKILDEGEYLSPSSLAQVK